MVKKGIPILAVASLLALLLAACMPSHKTSASSASAQPQKTSKSVAVKSNARVIRVSNGVSETHPMITALRKVFKPMVEQQTNGRYKVEIFYSNQLGNDTQATAQLRAGTLASCIPSTAPLVGFDPQLSIFDIAFLFPNYKVAHAVLDGKIGKELSAGLQKYGLVNLAWPENGFRDLTNSVRVVKTPADLKGLKIRTMDDTYQVEAWRLMGANPSPMAWSEVFTALQQHVVDGQENPIANNFTSDIQEVNKYWSLTNHIYSPFLFLFSKKIWDTIPSSDQAIIRKAAMKTADYERQLNEQAARQDIKKVEAQGVTVTTLTPAELKLFQQKTEPLWNSIGKKAGPALMTQLKEAIAKAEGNAT